MSKKGRGKIGATLLIIALAVAMSLGLVACDGSSSSYQLYNKDGTINQRYYNDMQDYFAKHPEKNPAR